MEATRDRLYACLQAVVPTWARYIQRKDAYRIRNDVNKFSVVEMYTKADLWMYQFYLLAYYDVLATPVVGYGMGIHLDLLRRRSPDCFL